MTRAEELFKLVQDFMDVHDRWAGDETKNTPPDLSYWKSAQAMLDAFNEGELPASCRRLSTAVFQFGQEVMMFDALDEVWPSNNFWEARERLQATLLDLGSPNEPTYIPSIPELVDQKVPHEQIARMYGLKNPDGSGKSHLIAKELKQPGSVIDENWVHPSDRDAEKESSEAQAAYAILCGHQQQRLAEEEAESQPCPQTPRELWEQEVPIKQSAKMLKKTETEVTELFSSFAEEEAANKVDPNEVDDLDRYQAFADWEYGQLKERASQLNIPYRGNPKRTWLIDEILKIEESAEEVPS